MKKFIEIQAGKFLMGIDATSDFEGNAAPQHSVWLDSFSIATVPVTRAEWSEFLSETGYCWNEPAEIDRVCPSPDHPVISVSWFDSNSYCDWLSKKIGCTIRLPSEAEWERACRGTQGQKHPNSVVSTYELASWVKANADHLRPVGASPSIQSPVGCLDMWENIREWCLDWYNHDEYKNRREFRNPIGPLVGEYKVFRGGNPLCSGFPCCAYRGWDTPTVRDHTTGFRLVKV